MGEAEEDPPQKGLDVYLSEGWNRVNRYLAVTRSRNILRRYFAMNAFDGAMTSLGVVIGAWLGELQDPGTIIGVILTGAVAMMVSGFSGTYMTESAERNHSLNELEDAMLVDLDETIYHRAGQTVSIIAAVVDGLAPFVASIPAVAPFLMVGALGLKVAFLSSIGLSLATLFLLGVYLGRISGGNLLLSGAKMMVSGVAVALIALFLNLH